MEDLHARLGHFFAIDGRQIGRALFAQLPIRQRIGIGAALGIGLHVDLHATHTTAQLRLKRHLHIIERLGHVGYAAGMFVLHRGGLVGRQGLDHRLHQRGEARRHQGHDARVGGHGVAVMGADDLDLVDPQGVFGRRGDRVRGLRHRHARKERSGSQATDDGHFHDACLRSDDQKLTLTKPPTVRRALGEV